MKADLVLDARAALGEGALWHADRLWWVDIDGCTVNAFDPISGRNRAWSVGQFVSTIVPRSRGGLVLGLHRGVGFFNPDSGALDVFADPAGGRPEMRCNDGKCDPRGRFFVGTMGLQKPRPPGAVYRVDPDLRVTPVIEGTGTANGLAWSCDESTMYFVDTATLQVSAFDYDAATGAISGRRPVVRFEGETGRPDGMTIDADGNLWVALYAGGCVVCCDPCSGRILERIEVPASRTTSCAFGGPELRELFITTGRDDTEVVSGGLYVASPGVCGRNPFSFAG